MPSPVDPYPSMFATLDQESLDILAAFANAEAALSSNSGAAVSFLELTYSAGVISRSFDSSAVTSLSDAEQLRLFPQLAGLFNLSIRTALYP